MNVSLFEILEARRLLSYSPAVPETQVEGNSTPSNFDLAVAGDGSFVIASSQTTGQTTTIIATRYSAAGQKIYSKTVDSGLAAGEVSVSTDANGDAVVGYTLELDNAAHGDEIYFKTISATGTLGSRTQGGKSDSTSENEWVGGVNVAMDDSGRFYLGYIHDLNRSQMEVKVGFYNAAGSIQGNQFTAHLFASPYANLHGLDLATVPDGSFATWTTAMDISDAFSTQLHTGKVSSSAVLVDAKLVDTLIGPAHSTHVPVKRVAANANGTWIVVYDTEAGSWVQRFDASGNEVGGAIGLGSAKKPRIASLSGGGFLVLLDGVVTNYDANGSAVSTPQGIGGGLTTLIGADDQGDLVLAYNKTAGGPVFARTLSFSPADDFAYLVGSALFVDGSTLADNIDITHTEDSIIVERGNQMRSFAADSVTSLYIHSYGGNDTIINETDLRSTMDGGDGNDQIFGGLLADRIYGGTGDDEIWGGDGADSIWGLDGYDSLYGNGGSDRIEGGAQPDHIRGNGGRDKLYGNGGNDRIYGGSSGDFIYGQDGFDQLFGEGGDDRLYGDDGSPDTLGGGAGNDTFITVDGAADQLFGDGGRDTLTSGDTSDVLISIEVTQ